MNWKKPALADGLWLGGLAVFGLALLCSTRAVSAAAAQGLALCLEVLLPSLFPFFVLSALLTASGATERLARLFRRPMEALFGLPGSCGPALLLGAIGGYPVGARTISQLYRQGLCGKQDALRALRFCNNAGPAFFVGAVGGGLLGDAGLGLRLYLIHLTAAFIVGFLSKNPVKSTCEKQFSFPENSDRSVGFPAVFLQAVTQSFSAFCNVCAFVLFFAVLTGLLRQSPLLGSLCRLLPGSAGLWQGVLCGSLEVTAGASLLAAASLPQKILLPSLSFLCGWGGLSVQCQSICLIQEARLAWGGYLRAKLLHGLLAAGLALLLPC